MQSVTRKQFKEAIEEGIVAAEDALNGGYGHDRPLLPRDWRHKLRRVGDIATECSRADFTDCPLTQAGLRDICGCLGLPSTLLRFAFTFDAALKPAACGARIVRVEG